MKNEITQTTVKTPAETPETFQGRHTYRPVADIIESSNGVSMILEMPGVAPDNIDITLEKRVLSIRGKIHPVQPEKLDLTYKEYGQGDYERAFTLSEDFDPNKIEARMSNGILTVKLPKAEAAQPKKIVVNAA